jgi:hypothetical protein
MKKKGSKFLTFMFSMLPGAGHMYMGFMKMGISFMSAFFLIIFLSSWLNIGPLLFVLPILWFYSFFDCMNKRCANDEEFAMLDDRYLFSLDKMVSFNTDIFQKRRLLAGVLVLLLGIYLVWSNLISNIYAFVPQEVYRALRTITDIAPQFILGVVIIILGIRLITGKKKESGCDVERP